MASRGSRFARRRVELGFTQEQLADMIGADRTTVGRIERGETTPHPHTRRLLGQALRVTPERLAELLIFEGGPGPIDAPALACPSGVAGEPHTTGVIDMYRRELLRLFGLAGSLLLVPPGLSADEIVDTQQGGDLNQLQDLNTHLWQVFGLSPSKQLVYPLVEEQARVLFDRLDKAKTAAEHRGLCTLASEVFQLAGEIFFDGNFYADAAHCYTLAASAAKEGGAHDQWACALTRHAYLSMYDHQYRQASTILSAAARVARRGDSQLTTRHWVAIVQAQAAAGQQDLERCERALEAAHHVTGMHHPNNPGGWLRFDGSRLEEERGACYLALGESEVAAVAFSGALQRASSPRRRGSLLTDLAVVGVRRRDPDQVLMHGHAAVDLAEQSHSLGYVGRKLHTLRTQLQPMCTNPRIAALDDRITAVLTTT